jgi:hypothetical protein
LTKSRIIYITGMKPKPPPAQHREALVRVLGAALERHDPSLATWLDNTPGGFTLVSWTSLLYAAPRDIALDLPGIERLLASPEPDAADCREVDRAGRRFSRIWHLLGDSYPSLTNLVASDALRETLAEVHRYLEDRDGIAGRIRAQVSDALKSAWREGARVLLIGHSLGSVLAYDTLWELSRREHAAGDVELFMTLGSPIATRFIRRQLQGASHPGPERFPANIANWLNVSARGELVALHPRVRPYFGGMRELGLARSIVDVEIYNHFRGPAGIDVHKSYGYLNHAAVAGAIGDWILSPA